MQLDIEPLPAIFSMDDSLARKEIIWRADNIFKSLRVDKGDVDAACGAAQTLLSKANTRPGRRSSFISSRRE